MTYAGLTTADKGALLDAQKRGDQWVTFFGGRMHFDAFFPISRGGYSMLVTEALAQIAEMERAEKPCPYCSTDAFSPSRVGLYGKNGFSPFHIYFAGGTARDGEQFDYCPKCARRINTEGERT